MNRIQALSQSDINQQSSFSKQALTIEAEQFIEQTAGSDIAEHTLFAPLHYEKYYAYPLLIWLHSSRGDEAQLKRIMPLISLRNYVAIGPRGTLDCDTDDSCAGYSWNQSIDDIQESERRVFACIERARKRFHVNPQRIMLAGYGSGGSMALRIGLANPESFAGVISIGGQLPRDHRPLADIERARDLPLCFSHCRDSQDYPVQAISEDLRLLHSAGMSVTVRQYPCGDELTTQMLSDLDTWMMEQLIGATTGQTEEDFETPDYIN